MDKIPPIYKEIFGETEYIGVVKKPKPKEKKPKPKPMKVRFELCFDAMSDKDIVPWLNQFPNKSDYVRQLIRADMKRTKRRNWREKRAKEKAGES